MTVEVSVVPTGTANMASIVAAFRRLGAHLTQVENAAQIREAEQLVVPGVGTFGAAMAEIDGRDWRSALVKRFQTGKATLAICVGMQLLCDESDESEGVVGIGAVRGSVTKFSGDLCVPQLGWNLVTPAEESRFLTPGWAYFANSYRLTSISGDWKRAETDYGGTFVSAIEKGDILACQFHPELSGKWGSELLGRWLDGTRGRP